PAVNYLPVAPPPAQPGEVRPDWDLVPLVVALPTQSNFLQLPMFLPIVPSGFSGVLRIALTLFPNAPDTFLLAAVGDPGFTGSQDRAFVTAAAAGAQAYLQQIFGITIPPVVVPQLQQYATTQFQQVIASGQSAFALTLGTQPEVYSLAQLQLDLAFFAAARAANAT